jgi:hypothetical protein
VEPYVSYVLNLAEIDSKFLAGMMIVVCGCVVCLLPETVGRDL